MQHLRPRVALFATWGIPTAAHLADFGADDLDEAERAHAASLTSASARSQFVSRRARLRDEMAALTGIRHEDVRYWRDPCSRCGGPHGRPRVVGFDGYVSTSSTPHVTALSIHDAPVGIDVEALASAETVRDVSPLLHPRERAAIDAALASSTRQTRLDTGDIHAPHAEAAVHPDAPRRIFTQIWTRKEALLKATGEGLSAPLDRDDVSDPAAHPVPGWHLVDITDDITGFDGPSTYGAWAAPREANHPTRA